MSDPYDLQRFVDGQVQSFDQALGELNAGSKQSHWMWFIFPQLAGLGRSPTALHYAISSIEEARAYLEHPLLGARLRQSVDAVMPWAGRRSAEEIFGPVDAMKFRSSLTLFDAAEPRSIFSQALEAFFGGARDGRTSSLLGRP